MTSNVSDSKRQDFLSLLNQAIQISTKKSVQEDNSGVYALAKKNLETLRESFLAGKVKSSEGGILGLSRNIGEFDEGELYNIAGKIDDYFSRNF